MRASLLLLLVVGGCATITVAPPKPIGPGFLAPQLVEAAGTWRGVERVRLAVDRSGGVTKMEVYHCDAGRFPAAARALLERELPGARALVYEREQYADLGWVNEVEVETADGRRCELGASDEGQLRFIECRVAPAQAPPAVAKALGALVPGAEIVEIELRKGPGIDEVIVEARSGERLEVLRLRPDGTVLARGIRLPATIDVPLP
jgi:hypothetical protein